MNRLPSIPPQLAFAMQGVGMFAISGALIGLVIGLPLYVAGLFTQPLLQWVTGLATFGAMLFLAASYGLTLIVLFYLRAKHFRRSVFNPAMATPTSSSGFPRLAP